MGTSLRTVAAQRKERVGTSGLPAETPRGQEKDEQQKRDGRIDREKLSSHGATSQRDQVPSGAEVVTQISKF